MNLDFLNPIVSFDKYLVWVLIPDTGEVFGLAIAGKAKRNSQAVERSRRPCTCPVPYRTVQFNTVAAGVSEGSRCRSIVASITDTTRAAQQGFPDVRPLTGTERVRLPP